MKLITKSIVVFLLVVSLFSLSVYSQNWVRQIGNSTQQQRGLAIGIDNLGNSYTTGYFAGTVDFDPGSGVLNLTSSSTADVFVVKLNATGDLVWAKSWGGTGGDEGKSIQIDGSGNVYVAGLFSTTVDFDPGAGTFNLTSAGLDDVFISKLDTDGNFVWAKRVGSTAADECNAIALDATGNIYATGAFNLTVDFDPSVSVANLTSAGGRDIFVLRLNNNGDFSWAKRLGAAGADEGNSITISTVGNVHVTGSFNNVVDFDPGAAMANLSSVGSRDVFIAKYSSSGNFVWAKSFGSSSFDKGASIATDASENVYTTGDFFGSTDFDPGIDEFILAPDLGSAAFVIKLTDIGDFGWANQFTGPDGGTTPFAIGIDGSANTYILGDTFDGTDDSDIILTGYDSNGNQLFQDIADSGAGVGTSLAVSSAGVIYATGYFDGNMNFNLGDCIGSAFGSNDDIFVFKTIATAPIISSFSPTTGAEGATVIITGTNFSSTPSANQVDFNGFSAVVTASTSTTITTSVPTGAVTGKIGVSTGCSTGISATDFTVISGLPPTISSFAPSSGSIGSTVVINGSGFSSILTNNVVQFNGTNAYVVNASATSLTVVVPPDATTGFISVTVSGNTATSLASFNVVPFSCPPATRQGGDIDLTFDPLVQDAVNFTAVELQSTGKSIVAAPFVTIDGSTYEGILRFNTDGSLDNSFSNSVNYYPNRYQLKVLPNDQILVVETGTMSYVRRLNADGSLDASFNFPAYYASTLYSIGYQSDGKVLLSLYDDAVTSDILYRYNTDGTIDNTFTAVPGANVNIILEQADGKILAAGASGVFRLDEFGSPDPSFSPITVLDGEVTGMVIQSTGKIVLVGTFTQLDGFPARNIVRLNSDGSIDVSFLSGNGFSVYSGSQPNALTLLDNDDLLVAGEFSTFNFEFRTRLVMLNADGSLRCSFDPENGSNTQILDVEVQSDRKILLVGAFTDYDGTSRKAYARVNGVPASCVPATERAALIALYNSTNGASWVTNTNWLSADENTWFGVSITGCHVTNLLLVSNNLNGPLPIEIGDFPQLETLQLSGNSLSGSIPTSIGNLSNLTELELDNNTLTASIPTTLGNITTLRNIRLDQNQLIGSLPNAMFNLTNLVSLELGDNQLSGSIPPTISNLTNLQALGLSGNQFTGALPTQIGSLLNLNRLQLGINQFSGNLPSSIGNLVNLTSFSVFNNQLTGTVPASLGNLVNLTGLGLSVNQFTGAVPPAIGLIPNLTDVSLRDNDFTSIPTFVSTSFTSLLVYGNKLNFGHLEPNVSKGGFVYAPQDNLPGGVASACAGSTLTINFSTPGSANQYQWFKDGVLVPGATSASFNKVNVSLSDSGNYTVSVTNTIATGLTLQSDPFVVTINPQPTAPTTTGASICGSGTLTLTASGGAAGEYRWYTVASGGTAISGEVNSSFVTPVLTSTTTYYVAINNGTCESARTPVTATITVLPSAPATTPGSNCGSGVVTLSASGGAAGEYRWYTVATGGTAISGEVNGSFVTPVLTSTTTYYVSITSGTCESARSAVVATINPVPAAPAATSANRCGPGSVTLTASGGSAGQYRWYTVATGGTAITGQTNASFVTPSISATTIYYVSIGNGTCESARTAITATINAVPTKPVITPSGTLALCAGQSVILSAPAGFSYLWSNGSSAQQITVTSVGSFTVVVSNGTCSSVPSDAVVTTTAVCNQPPVITTSTSSTPVESKASINLSQLISDPDNNLDLTTLRVVGVPKSRAVATIVNGVLLIDYSGVSFAGLDEIIIEVCDLAGVCVRQTILIEVIGELVVYNGLSANDDQLNAAFLLRYIELLPETQQNTVSIYNRWGDEVWQGVNYNNTSVVFTGLNKNGNVLPSGTYFYKVEFASGKKTITGYLSLKR